MRLKIFSDAIKLQSYLEEYGTTHNKIHFRFKFPNEDEILAYLEIKDNCTKLSCTCKAGSIHYDSICSHKIAIILYLLKKSFKKMYKSNWAKHLYGGYNG